MALEAMACGKAVIAAGSKEYFELVKPDNFAQAWAKYFGDHGCIHPLSSSALAREVQGLARVRPSLAALGTARRHWVADTFAIERVCDTLLAEYEREVKLG